MLVFLSSAAYFSSTSFFFFFNDTATTEIYTLSLHDALPITELTADEAILHALNRLAYGPRPGDIERIKQIGLAKWIDQQLNPNSINDAALEARLEIYPTLKMQTAQLLAEYPNPKQAVKQELKAQNQNAPGADPAINSVAQEMDSSSPAAKTADSSGAA